MQTLTNTVSSDVTNSTPEPTKAVKTAKQLAAQEALKAMSAVLSPERGVKAKARREEVAANKKESLGKKLGLLTAGSFDHKGKRKTLNVRQTVIEMVKAARLGATAAQLTGTNVVKRFQWANIEAPVRAYIVAAGEHAAVVLAVLYPAVEAEQSAPVAEPATDASKPAAKAALPKSAAKPQATKRTVVKNPVRKAG
jgi:hypothetical protein